MGTVRARCTNPGGCRGEQRGGRRRWAVEGLIPMLPSAATSGLCPHWLLFVAGLRAVKKKKKKEAEKKGAKETSK